MLINVFSKVSPIKNIKVIFKRMVSQKKIICMWILVYYQEKWSEEFKLDYCPYDGVYIYLPGCFSFRNYVSWRMVYIFLCLSKMFQVLLRINCFHWVTNIWVSEDHYKLTNSWTLSVDYCSLNPFPKDCPGMRETVDSFPFPTKHTLSWQAE